MTGQNLHARRVMVFIETDGLNHGWEVISPTRVSWDFTGLVAGSTHATVTVSGEFHRITKYGEYVADEIEAGTPEIGPA
jgi:hypothetical protein